MLSQTAFPKVATAVAMAITMLTIFATSLTVAGAASAVPHPDHSQKNRDNGPAAYETGQDRKNPNGSNGTIKIDGVEFDGTYDGHPNNEPHVSCQFQVDFSGFDSDANGDTAELVFRHWNPSNGKVEVLALFADADDADAGGNFEPIRYVNNEFNRLSVPLDNDGAGGGVDLDRQVLIELVLPNTDPGAGGNHGDHVRLDTYVTSNGKTYKKTKVFWVGECEPTKDFRCGFVGTTTVLAWNELPFASGYDVARDGVVIAKLGADVLSYDLGGYSGEYTVTAHDVAGRQFSTKLPCIILPAD